MTTRVAQSDFGGGIFRSEHAPAGHVWDAVNALIDDERALVRRGGAVQLKTGVTGRIMVDRVLTAGQRTVLLGPTGKVTDAARSTFTSISGIHDFWPSRVTGTGGLLIGMFTANLFWYYAGSLKSTYRDETGTLTFTNGSDTVTGVGTSFASLLDVGSIVEADDKMGVVRQIDSDTQLVLMEPWRGASGTPAGPIYTGNAGTGGFTWPGAASSAAIGVAGTAGRLIIGRGSRLQFSPLGQFYAPEFDVTDFIDLPVNAQVIAIEGVGGNALVFTSAGIFQVTNVDFDLTDDAGNPQRSVRLVTPELVALSDAGITTWAGRIVVPARDNVYLVTPDGAATPVGDPIGALYRAYVDAGYIAGQSAVYRGHLVLPIVDPSGFQDVQDVLVCRLDRGAGWTRWGAGALCMSFARTVDPAGKLLGWRSATGLLDVSGCFTPGAGNTTDPTSAGFSLDVTSNDLELPLGTILKFGVRYNLATAGALAASYSTTAGATFTSLAGSAGVSDGSQPFRWRLPERTRRVRLRLLSSGAPSTLRVREIEYLTRPSIRP